MVINPKFRSTDGWSVLDLTALCVPVGILLFLAVYSFGAGKRQRVQRIQCVNNLKDLGLGLRIHAPDDLTTKSLTPFEVFFTTNSPVANPRIFICPADPRPRASVMATNVTGLQGSYFFSMEAYGNNPAMILAGDGNVTNSQPPVNGILTVGSGAGVLPGFDGTIHRSIGNVAMSDGSVRMIPNNGFAPLIGALGRATQQWAAPRFEKAP